ncbi:MAG: response regulator [Coleofasciculaceae cyanobacterium SM2_3_26]|nr:response regulator [Coleofasciculaceae cyanobacterium SM2_3_26]
MRSYILAVDDNPDNLFLVQLALEQDGYTLHLVDNGAEALAVMEQSPPDLVLLDVMMPGIDGYEVTRRIRSNPNLPFIPILMITAYEQPSLVKGLDAGADEFIRKPIKVDELQARVRSLLRLKQSIDQRENFVRCLTHDLRTPLVAADRMYGLLRQGVFGQVSAEMDGAIATLASSNQNLLNMLNNLLEVYCYDIGQKVLSFVTFDLCELLGEVVNELRPLALDKQLELQLDLPNGTCLLRGDRLELRRVFANLIGNGIKFTDKGSVEVRLKPQPDAIAVAVEDTGIGIAPDDRKAIFDPFRQGKHKRKGHGLGLHLCQQIVRAHEGRIDLMSEVGRGSQFTVQLPRRLNPSG